MHESDILPRVLIGALPEAFRMKETQGFQPIPLMSNLASGCKHNASTIRKTVVSRIVGV